MLNIPIHEVLQWTLLSWIFSILLGSFKQKFSETKSFSIIMSNRQNAHTSSGPLQRALLV